MLQSICIFLNAIRVVELDQIRIYIRIRNNNYEIYVKFKLSQVIEDIPQKFKETLKER